MFLKQKSRNSIIKSYIFSKKISLSKWLDESFRSILFVIRHGNPLNDN